MILINFGTLILRHMQTLFPSSLSCRETRARRTEFWIFVRPMQEGEGDWMYQLKEVCGVFKSPKSHALLKLTSASLTTVNRDDFYTTLAIGSNINQCIVKHLTCTSWYRGNCHIILVFSIAAAAWCDHLIPRLWLAPRSGIASSARRPLSCCRPRLWPWSKDVAMYHCWSIHLFNWVQHLTFSLSSHRVRGQWVGYIGTAVFSVLPNTFGRDEVTIAPTIEDVTL